MRSLNANAIAEIANKTGTRPINVLAVDWSDDDSTVYYADVDVQGATGRIINIGDLDNIITSSQGTSTAVAVTLDDTDGTIKNILNYHDVHKRKCVLYQYFADLDWDDKFVIFEGQISTPITWGEADRTVQFNILTEIEDKEVGFSPEEAQFPFVSFDAVGKPWPLCFGQVQHVPATKVKQAPTGTLNNLISYVNPLLKWQIQALTDQFFFLQLTLSFVAAAMASSIGTTQPYKKILLRYCALINAQDNIVFAYQQLIRDIHIDRRPRWRFRWVENAIRQNANNVFGLMAIVENMEREKKDLQESLGRATHKNNMRSQLEQEQKRILAEMNKVYVQFMKLKLEQCKQSLNVPTAFIVEGGNQFTQGTPTDIVVGGLRYRGTFNGDTFSDLAVIPYYVNIPVLGVGPSDDCSEYNTDETSGLNKFIIPPGYSLKGKYCWVKSRFDQKLHIIKVTEQFGSVCTFELTPFNTDYPGGGNSSNGLINSLSAGGYGVNPYSGPFGRLPNGFGPNGMIQPGIAFGPGNIFQAMNFNQPRKQRVKKKLRRRRNKAQVIQIEADFWPATKQALGEHFPVSHDEYRVIIYLQNLISGKVQPQGQNVDSNNGNDVITLPIFLGPRSVYTIIAEDIESIYEASVTPLDHWLDGTILMEEIPQDEAWTASPGSEVFEISKLENVFVANILPSTIVGVCAYRSDEKGTRYLSAVPSHYYTYNEAEDLGGGLVITSLRFPTPLKLMEEGWEDELYVSLNSSVGNNTVDILEHLITTYTDKDIDASSFSTVRTKVANYPSNFALFDRKNVFTQLSEIAWQARLSLRLASDEFKLTYLPNEPVSLATLTDSDINSGSLTLSLTETEDLVTKLTATWKRNYLPLKTGEQPLKFILRNNISKYGLHEQEYDFYIYNNEETVRKAATFWFLRQSNTWKQADFDVFLNHLNLEAGDTITLDLAGDHLTTGAVKATVQSAIFDPMTNTVKIGVWLPVLQGTMTKYKYAWPADESGTFLTENTGRYSEANATIGGA